MITVEKQYTSVPLRLPIVNSQLRFDDAILANGVLDTEDKNGNGVLDIIIGLDGQILYNEDTGIGPSAIGAGNGELDSEPLIDPSNIFHGFHSDIARDLELVLDNDGKVVGYVILDGLGVLWPFGNNIGADVVRPENTNGIAGTDIFRDLELIVENGVIVDFITITGTGVIFGSPGGPLGAGASGDVAGYLSAEAYGLTTYSFDIVRDIEMSPIDSNNDGQINYQDGFYVLTGLGTIQAIGGALPIENAPFLGIDIARDLEFGTTLPE